MFPFSSRYVLCTKIRDICFGLDHVRLSEVEETSPSQLLPLDSFVGRDCSEVSMAGALNISSHKGKFCESPLMYEPPNVPIPINDSSFIT